MITAAVLAAGSGKRIGQAKALLQYKQRSFLENILINLNTAGINDVFIVLGQEFEQIKKLLSSKYPYTFIHNRHPENGPLSSFRLALEKMPPDTTGCLLVLVDHPLVSSETYRKLKSLGEQITGAILIPVYQGKKGHPVYFDKKFFPEFFNCPLNEGARYVVRRNQEAIQKFETEDKGVIADIDTREDFNLYIGNR